MREKPLHDAAGRDAESHTSGPGPATDEPRRDLTPAARRALAEAEARRAEMDRKPGNRPHEVNGRDGPDPARYGDWEVKGIASDF